MGVLACQHKDFQAKLPDEILYTIFQNLHISDLSRCCAVSKRWNSIGSDSLLWRNLSVAIENVSPRADPNPNSISHQLVREVSYDLLSGSFTSCYGTTCSDKTNQRNLDLLDSQERDADPFEDELWLQQLIKNNRSTLIERIRSAKSISLHSNNRGGIVSPNDVLACLDILGEAQQTSSLSFEGISLKRHSFDVAALLAKLPCLTSLTLRQTLVSSYAIVSFNSLLSLRHLDLSYTDVGDFALDTIARHGHNLRQLKMDAVYKVTRDGLMDFFNMWMPKHLELLSMNYIYYLPPTGMIRWAKRMSELTEANGSRDANTNASTSVSSKMNSGVNFKDSQDYSLQLDIKGCECFTMQDIELIERTLPMSRINHTTLLECHSLDAYRRFIDRISHGRLISKLDDEDDGAH